MNVHLRRMILQSQDFAHGLCLSVVQSAHFVDCTLSPLQTLLRLSGRRCF